MRLWEVIDKRGNNDRSVVKLCMKGENDGGMGKNYFFCMGIFTTSFLWFIFIPLLEVLYHHLLQQSHCLVIESSFSPSFPGQNWITMLNVWRYLDQWTCLRVRTLVVEKYSRFLWSITTSIGSPEPSR